MTAKNVADEVHEIRWLAFVGALVSAPFIVAIFGFWAYLPVFAVAYGLPTYLVFGTPFFILVLRLYGPNVMAIVIAGMAANLLSYPAVALATDMATASFVTGFGLFFAPLWSAAFVWIYRTFTRE